MNTADDPQSWTTLAQLAKGKVPDGRMRMQPYWWRAAPPLDGPWPALPARIDVLIVGAGFTGLSAALTLARAGREVLVVDAGVPGFGASTRNGGQVGSGNQKFRVKTLIAMKGERHAVALLKEGVAMLDHIERLIAEENIDCDFVRCGRFRGAMRPDHYEAMARDLEDLHRYTQVAFEMVSRAAQHREIGSELFHGGSLLPLDASLDPGRYHTGLLLRVQSAGGAVRGHAAVRDITPEAGGFNVRFDDGALTARDVLVATNGYTKAVGRFFTQRMVPVGSAQIVTGPIPAALFRQLMPSGRVYGNTSRVFSYFRPAPGERRIIWGGRASHLHDASRPAAYAHLARDLLRAFPGLGNTLVTDGWTGQIGYTFDEFPHLGCAPNGVHYALGYCGTGVSRSTYFGRMIGLKILGHPGSETAFDNMPLPGHPLQFLSRLAVPAIESWYRLRDRGNF
ncbi:MULTISPECIES: FAD-binding oxidoreductase [Rhodopseudomonas]|uniref:FAD-dependent oxidoreductase n=1 Tax=Rhodopseudomonas palustris TaxID=1076 RepID=A0A0D7EQ66_RHOPL|nr:MULTISPECIES: FAD-binding oxidoreductase [Rhodopseudomonas]KIZ41612.1 FAD-dependent oxidoreductase [Rhodopseudomonas palustris]MDF3812541.1 FAD-binding oxidoreductase [Rhodopseudomonas sp. BAL398]WOK19871.1 FAD-binding oxidoreductase [Rhodopseudomonas sp. BAL398]